MITVDEFVKLLLAFSIAFAIVVISYQLMRVLAAVADSVRELKRTLGSVGDASEMVLSDYQKVKRLLSGILGVVSNFQDNIISPFNALKNSSWFSRPSSASENESGE